MNINDYTKSMFGDKEAFQKMYKETEDIVKQTQKIREARNDINEAFKGLK